MRQEGHKGEAAERGNDNKWGSGITFGAAKSGMGIIAVEAFMDTVVFAWRVSIASATSGVPLKTYFTEGFGRPASLGTVRKNEEPIQDFGTLLNAGQSFLK